MLVVPMYSSIRRDQNSPFETVAIVPSPPKSQEATCCYTITRLRTSHHPCGRLELSISKDSLRILHIEGLAGCRSLFINLILQEIHWGNLNKTVRTGVCSQDKFPMFKELGFEPDLVEKHPFGEAYADLRETLKTLKTLDLNDSQAVAKFEKEFEDELVDAKRMLARLNNVAAHGLNLSYVKQHWSWEGPLPTLKVDPTAPKTLQLSATFSLPETELMKWRFSMPPFFERFKHLVRLAPLRCTPPLCVRRLESEEFLHCLSLAERTALDREMVTSQATLQEQAILLAGQWDHPLFKEATWPHKAFKAFLSGTLNKWDISRLFLYAESCKTVGYQTHSLQESTSKVFFKQSLHDFLNEQQWNSFLERIATENPKELQFFSVPFQGSFTDTTPKSILKAVVAEGWDVFTIQTPNNQGNFHLVIPPFLYYQLLKAKYGKEAMEPNPVFGISKGSDFQSLTHRPVAIPSPFVSVKNGKEADGFPATALTFYHHDLFHLHEDSNNLHKGAWIELGLHCSTFNLAKKDTIGVRTEFFDRPFPHYWRRVESMEGPLLSPSEKFWLGLGKTYRKLFTSYGEEAAVTTLMNSLNYINFYRTSWKENYDIDFESLDAFAHSRYSMKHKASLDILVPLMQAKEKIPQSPRTMMDLMHGIF